MRRLLKYSLGIGALSASVFVVRSYPLKAHDSPKMKEKKKSIIVIGGGIMGLGTAFHLAERGHKITLIEQANETATWSSGANGSLLCPSVMTGWADSRIRGKGMKVTKDAILDPQFWRWGIWFVSNAFLPGRAQKNNQSLMNLTEYSLKCQKTIEENYPQLHLIRCARNTLKLFASNEALTKFLESDVVSFWRGKGYDYKVLSPEECKKLVPMLETRGQMEKTIAGGAMIEPSTDTSADIKPFCENLERECRRLGVTILNSTEVIGINMDNNRIDSVDALQQIEGKESSIRKEINLKADAYVVCAGHKSYDLGKKATVNLPIYPLRGGVVTVRLKDGSLNNELPYSIYSTGISVVICPMDNNRIRLSSEVQAVGKDLNACMDTSKLSLSKGLTVLDKDRIDISHAEFTTNMRPVSGDDLPMIGKTYVDNLYANTGHGSKGWTLSFGSNKLIADIIDGNDAEIDPEPYSPKRFHPFRKFFS